MLIFIVSVFDKLNYLNATLLSKNAPARYCYILIFSHTTRIVKKNSFNLQCSLFAKSYTYKAAMSSEPASPISISFCEEVIIRTMADNKNYKTNLSYLRSSAVMVLKEPAAVLTNLCFGSMKSMVRRLPTSSKFNQCIKNFYLSGVMSRWYSTYLDEYWNNDMPMRPPVANLFRLSRMHRLQLFKDIPIKRNFIYLCRKISLAKKHRGVPILQSRRRRISCVLPKETT